jgi:amidophosphoribosyltransferase
MYGIQHRGQDASGISLVGVSHEIHTYKSMGLFSKLLEAKSWDINVAKDSRLGIGQVRYPTVGANTIDEAQPFTYTDTDFSLSIAHNGNIVNVTELEAYLRSEYHYELTTKSDLEYIYAIFVNEYKRHKDMYEVFKIIDRLLIGSYSVIGIVKGKLFAYRDRFGIRPLLVGKNNEACVFSSESTVFDLLGIREFRDITPGTIVTVDDGSINEHLIADAHKRTCFFEWIYFSSTSSTLENANVYDVRYKLGELISKKYVLPDIVSGSIHIDLVAPVPDSSRPAAVGAGNALGIPIGEVLMKNRYFQRTFIMADHDGRRSQALRHKLQALRAQVEGKSILLIDDSIVRGHTSKRIISILKEAGATHIYFMVVCPPIAYPCFYGIDIPDENELIAHGKNTQEITQIIEADKMYYPTMNEIYEVLGHRNVCSACVDANYPTLLCGTDTFVSRRREERCKK